MVSTSVKIDYAMRLVIELAFAVHHFNIGLAV
jgi:hypothetical protein